MGALALTLLLVLPIRAQDGLRPPVGGVSSPADAMIFYVARGPTGTCGPGCSEWIAAEGAVQWDTYKRLLALLDRLGGRKMPVILKVGGEGNLNVATALGRIIRERGLDTSVGTTRVSQCWSAADAACFAIKRAGAPVDASVDHSFSECEVVCLLILAGGVQRTLPADARVVIEATHIKNRLAPNVSREHEEGLKSRFGDQFRLYLKQMGVSPEMVDIIDQAADSGQARALRRDEWLRLGIVTNLAL